ncbi:MAG: Pr6Pr family membrane protein [Acidobacteria bacterium]|nr:Pr6Pr family membrane protein [Acidobacteriota bacterium]
MSMKRGFAGLIAIIGWAVIALEFYLTMAAPREPSVPANDRIIRFFSYFTILTNIVVAVTTTAIAFFPSTKIGRFFSRPGVQTAVAVYITIVGLVYSLLLRASLTGLWAVADHGVHDVVPIAYVVFWFICTPKSGLGWKDPIKWLSYPLAYVAYSLVHGAFTGWYPYWFVDISKLGYAVGLRNAAGVILGFVVVGLIFVAVGRAFSRTAKALSN